MQQQGGDHGGYAPSALSQHSASLSLKQIYHEARGLYLVATEDYLANTPFEHSKLDDYQLLVRLAILTVARLRVDECLPGEFHIAEGRL